ncbi:MAG: hypothetical protein P1Q69_12025 [Candidatus Thorarchaeota archaeon]|nr:hypothetical protein [Candidatus Thorarchaeota archaeon]
MALEKGEESGLRERYQEYIASREEEEVPDDDTIEYEVDDEESIDESDLEGEEDSGEVSKVHEDVIFRYVELEVRGKNVIVSLESENGDCEDVQVVEKVNKYLKISKLAGGIYRDEVETEVTESLAPYDLEDGELEEIMNAVCEALEKEGVNFYE